MNGFVVGHPARAVDEVPVAGEPSVKCCAQSSDPWQADQHSYRPQPPDRVEQNRPHICAADHPPVSKFKMNLRAQFIVAHLETACGSWSLQGQPAKTTPRKHTAPARRTARTDVAASVVKYFAAPATDSGFRIHNSAANCMAIASIQQPHHRHCNSGHGFGFNKSSAILPWDGAMTVSTSPPSHEAGFSSPSAK